MTTTVLKWKTDSLTHEELQTRKAEGWPVHLGTGMKWPLCGRDAVEERGDLRGHVETVHKAYVNCPTCLRIMKQRVPVQGKQI